MKRTALMLVAIILIAGCTASQLDVTVKNLPQAKAFLEEYPEATIKTAVYSPVAIKNVADKFADDCPSLGEEGKSYYKVTIIDEPSKQQMIMWLDSVGNKFICAIRTSLTEEKVTTTTAEITTTLPPTTALPTTIFQTTTTTTLPTSTTTTLVTTTTAATTTTTANATTTSAPTTTTVGATPPAAPSTTSSTTTTTLSGPDLYVSQATVTKVDTDTSWYNVTYTVTNKGNQASNLGRVDTVIFRSDNTTYTVGAQKTLSALNPGASAILTSGGLKNTPAGSYRARLFADAGNTTTETDEDNNYIDVIFAMPMP